MRTLLIAVLLLTAAQCDAGSYAALIKVAALKTHPNPAPAPAPSGQCDNCNGTGKLGDGTVSVTCPVCDGTGKAKQVSPAPVTRAILSHAPVKPTRQTAPAGGFYPTRGSLWSYPGSVYQHIFNDHDYFDRAWVRSLSTLEASSLHSDAHNGRINWSYAVRKGQVAQQQPANRGGRWVTKTYCDGRRCRTVREWQAF